MTVTKANLGQVILANRNGHLSEMKVTRFSKDGLYVRLISPRDGPEWLDPDSVKVVEVLEEARAEAAPQQQQQSPAKPVVLPDPAKDPAPAAPATTGGSPGPETLQQPTLT